ncbi:hypothetical protein GGR52DRAFT_589222 [Hypoxylon sp. FL1284]|nr:hypothetical protein GGR52DRAFT_589222 [Hypoxylon sp. FL1284]
MGQNSNSTFPPGNSKPRPIRTARSVVWTAASGKKTTAEDLVSSVRFSWDSHQKLLFEHFLRTVGLGFKNADITPLLIQLNLDGYEKISNYSGQNVHLLIMEKIRHKLKNTADEMDEEVLLQASHSRRMQLKTLLDRPKAGVDNSDDSETHDGVLTPTTTRDNTPGEKAKVMQPSRESLTFARPKVTPPTSLPPSNVKCEPETSPPYIFASSPRRSTSTPPPAGKVKKREPRPFDISGLKIPKVEVPRVLGVKVPNVRIPNIQMPKAAPVSSRNSKNATQAHLHDATHRLAALLSKADLVIKEIKNLVDELPDTHVRGEMAKTVRHMKNAFCDVEVDAEDLGDTASAEFSSS